jgi:hypothetical protein
VRAVVSERVLPHSDDDPAAHFLLLVCDVRVVDGEAAEYDEGAVGWFTAEAIARLAGDGAIIPSDDAMLRAYAVSTSAAPLAEVIMQSPATMVSFDRFEAV